MEKAHNSALLLYEAAQGADVAAGGGGHDDAAGAEDEAAAVGLGDGGGRFCQGGFWRLLVQGPLRHAAAGCAGTTCGR